MQIILLERIARLGNLGDIVNVKNGYARNYLLPQKKALRATEANKAIFESKRAELEAKNLEAKAKAEHIAKDLHGKTFVAIRSAGETGHLYGSVTTRDIAEILSADDFDVNRTQIELHHPLKTIGIHNININLHGDVIVAVKINIARSAEEAEKQKISENQEKPVEEILSEEIAKLEAEEQQVESENQ